MKTRVNFTEVTIFNLNPFTGWDAEVPEELYLRYLKACREFGSVAKELFEHLQPFAEEVDRETERHFARNGLSLLSGKE